MKKRKNNSAAGHVKMSEFASQTIKTALIPNTNRDSVKHKHQKLLTNTQHKPYAHINKQRRKKQQKNPKQNLHKLIPQIEGWQTSQRFYVTNRRMITAGPWEAFAP